MCDNAAKDYTTADMLKYRMMHLSSRHLARKISLVLAGAEACSSSNIKGPSTEGPESEGECEPVFEYHDSSGGPASGVRPLTAVLQQLCVRIAECYAAVPLPWV